MDITKCQSTNCPLRETCGRWENSTIKKYLTVQYQSYFVTPPYDFKNKECEYYMGTRVEKLVSLKDIFSGKLNGKGR